MPSDQEMSAWNDYYADEVTMEGVLGNLCSHVPLLRAVEDVQPSRVLEVGVGTGTMSWFLGARGLEIVGVDYEERIIDRARAATKAIPGASYVVGDAFKLSEIFAPHEFDVAFSQGFFEHFGDDDIRELARQQLSAARHVLFSVPSDQYPQADVGDERLMSPPEWCRILDGLGAVRAEYYGEIRHGWFGRLKGRPAVEHFHVLVSLTQMEPG